MGFLEEIYAPEKKEKKNMNGRKKESSYEVRERAGYLLMKLAALDHMKRKAEARIKA